MKKQMKWLALVLALALIVSSIPMSFHVLAEDQNSLYVYNAANDFSAEQNPNGVWSYQYRANANEEFANMSNAESGSWKDKSEFTVIAAKADKDNVTNLSPVILLSPQNLTAQNALVFTAPYSGTITIKMTNGGVFAPNTSAGTKAVWFKMSHNEKTVVSNEGMDASNNAAANRVFADTVTLLVAKGDVIRFVVGRNKTVSANTYLNPQIEYTEVLSFNALKDFSATENPNGVWSYQYKSGTNFINLDKRAENDGWTNTNSGTIQVGASYFTSWNSSATLENVISFTAPYSGTISISMANGGVKGTNAAQTPRFKLYKNNDVLMDELVPVAGSFTEAQELTVKKGDIIRFATMRSAQGASGHAIFNPEIIYTDFSADFDKQANYDALKDFSATENPNGVWSYQYKSGATFTNLDKRAENDGWTNASSGTIQVGADYFTSWNLSSTLENVIAFTAPYSGTISVFMANGAVKGTNAAQTPRFKLYKNDDVLIDETVPAEGSLTEAQVLTVKKGDVIRFATMRSGNASGHAILNPAVVYTEFGNDSEKQTDYNSLSDFSATENPNGVWSYQYKSGATFTNLDKRAENDGWTNASSGTIQVGASYFTSWNNSATLENAIVFTAPYSGTISVSMANGAVKGTNAAQTPRFKLYKNDDVLIDETVPAEGSLTEAQVLTVKKGDVIRFATMRSVQSASGHAILSPAIVYTEFGNDSYHAAVDYSSVNNPNGVWSYQYRNTLTAPFENITTLSGTMWWPSNAVGGIGTVVDNNTNYIIAAPQQSGRQPVLAFTAPYTGKISISMTNGILKTPNANHNAYFTMFYNGTELVSNALITSTGYAFEEMTLDVNEGDIIRFAFNRTASGAGNVYFNPEIEYQTIITGEEATYYVSYSTGSDSNHGMNKNAPWKNLSKLRDVELSAGDQIYLMAGDTWTTQLVLNNVSGTKENPVLITSYGSGAKPVLSYSVAEDASTPALETATAMAVLNDVEGLEIDGLSFVGAEDGTKARVGIHLAYNNTFNNEYVKIENCDFTNLTGFDIRDYRGTSDRSGGVNITGDYMTAAAITYSSNNYNIGVTDPALIGLYIDGCTTNNCGSLLYGAGSILGTNEGASTAINGLYITNSTMSNNDYYGTVITSVEGGYMSDCVVDGCGAATEKFGPGTAGIMISAKDFTIVNTEIKNQLRGGCAYDGVAIDFEHLCENVNVKNCYIHDNSGSSVFFYDSGAGSEHANNNCSVTYTTFVNNATDARGTTSPEDPFADIRITSNSGYALTNSAITNNQYFNDVSKVLLTYKFISDFRSASYSNVTIDANTELSAKPSEYYLLSKELVLAELKNELDGYNNSEYTFEKRVGTEEPKYPVINTVAFKHFEDFSNEKRSGTVWQYKYYSSTDGWQDMTLTPQKTSWQYGETTAIITADLMHPHSKGQTVLTFVAPESGRIRISMEDLISVNASSADGVYITVLDKDYNTIAEPVWVKSNSSEAFVDTYTTVQKGDVIYFCLSKCENSRADGTTIKPVVEYVYNDISVDDSNTLNVLDFIKMNKLLANGSNDDMADMNADGSVNVYDLVLLRKCLLGIWK